MTQIELQDFSYRNFDISYFIKERKYKVFKEDESELLFSANTLEECQFWIDDRYEETHEEEVLLDSYDHNGNHVQTVSKVLVNGHGEIVESY